MKSIIPYADTDNSLEPKKVRYSTTPANAAGLIQRCCVDSFLARVANSLIDKKIRSAIKTPKNGVPITVPPTIRST